MRSNRAGFVLIELIIVLVIIVILSAIAIPQLGSYQKRAYRADACTITMPVKEKIEAFFAVRGRFPANNRETGLLPSDKIKSNYVSSVWVEGGAIHITFRPSIELSGHIFSIQPSILPANSAAPIVWVYGGKDIPEGRKLIGNNRTTDQG